MKTSNIIEAALEQAASSHAILWGTGGAPVAAPPAAAPVGADAEVASAEAPAASDGASGQPAVPGVEAVSNGFLYQASIVHPPKREPTDAERAILDGFVPLPMDLEERALVAYACGQWQSGQGLVWHSRGVCRSTLEERVGLVDTRLTGRGAAAVALRWISEVLPRAMCARPVPTAATPAPNSNDEARRIDAICAARGFGPPVDEYGRVNNRASAEDFDMTLSSIKQNTRMAVHLRTFVRRYGPGPVVPTARLDAHPDVALRFAELRDGLARIVEAREALPGMTGHAGTVGFELLARRILGHERGDTLRWFKPWRRLVREAAAVCGVRCEGQIGPGMWTYGALADFGAERIAARLAGQDTATQGLRNRQSALRVFMEQLGRTPDDDARADLGPAIERRLAASGRSRSWKSHVREWSDLLRELSGERGQWPSASVALSEIRISRGYSYDDLARVMGTTYGRSYKWTKGSLAPSPHHAVHFEALEDECGYERGTLTGLLRGRSGGRLKASNGLERLPRKVSRYMAPGDADLSPDALAQKAARVLGTRVRQPSRAGATRQWMQRVYADIEPIGDAAPYLGERGLIMAYKCAKVSLSGPRGRRGRWKEATANFRLDALQRAFALMRLPVAKGGLGVSDEELSIALALNPLVFVEAILIRSGLLAGARSRHGLRGGILTQEDRQMLVALAGMLKAASGFVRRDPSLRDRLRANTTPLTRLSRDPRFDAHLLDPSLLVVMPEATVALARENYEVACAIAEGQARQVATDLLAIVESGKDTFEPFQALSDLTVPMAGFYRLMYESERRMPDPVASPRDHHVAMRAAVLARIVSLTFLRSKNLRKLTYLEDQSGKLRFVDGQWEVHIPWREFKNGEGTDQLFGPWASKMDYRRVLPDHNGLYDLLRRYVEVSLPVLRGQFPGSPYIFPTLQSPFPSTTSMAKIFSEWTRLHCVYDEDAGTGMPGLMTFGLHGVRDLGATTVLKDKKNPNRLQEAADLLQTSVAMVVNRYAKLDIVDRTGGADPALEAASKLALGGTPLWADAA